MRNHSNKTVYNRGLTPAKAETIPLPKPQMPEELKRRHDGYRAGEKVELKTISHNGQHEIIR